MKQVQKTRQRDEYVGIPGAAATWGRPEIHSIQTFLFTFPITPSALTYSHTLLQKDDILHDKPWNIH